MTTPVESVQLIKYLRDHRFIGESCWADDEETLRDHEGWECGAEVAEYDAWERAMRSEEAPYGVEQTFFQIRSLAKDYWNVEHPDPDARTEIDSLFAVSDNPAYQERATGLVYEKTSFEASRFAGEGVRVTEEDTAAMVCFLQGWEKQVPRENQSVVAETLGNLRGYIRDQVAKPSERGRNN